MVRFETVEVTKEIMKNMAKKPQSLRKTPKTSSRNKKAAVTPESGLSSPAGSSSPSSSSSSSYSSEFSGGEDVSSQPSPRGSDSPVYCVMSTIPHIEDEPGGLPQEDCEDSGTSGAVQALTEVARGLGMDVVWLSTLHWFKIQMSSVASHVAVKQLNWFVHFSIFCCGAVSGDTTGTGLLLWHVVYMLFSTYHAPFNVIFPRCCLTEDFRGTLFFIVALECCLSLLLQILNTFLIQT